jgi:hypothetical protein
MTQFHNPATATLEEARHVVELIRKSMRYASGEDHADLSYELATWERVVREREEDVNRPAEPALDRFIAFGGLDAIADGRIRLDDRGEK